jgi:hypothetical protein
MATSTPIPLSSLSAGDIIYLALSSDAGVAAMVTAIYPVVEPAEAVCPYIAYRRLKFEANPQKAGQPGADTIQMEVSCYALDYEEGVELAERVRGVLDYQQHEIEGLRMRGCYLSASTEELDGDAFVQNLVFTIKI